MNEDDLLAEQVEYYRARAPEYDDWPSRKGRYDRGPEHRERWLAEVEEVRTALRAAGPTGRVLEIACGTGWWTSEIVKTAQAVTAVDASPEVLAINRAKVASDKVQHLCANVFEWSPEGRYDMVFFSFWLSHVPPDHFERFWALVQACLEPGGSAFFIDSRHNGEYHWTVPDADTGPDWVARREISDGRSFDIVKVFYGPAELEQRLAEIGWEARVSETDNFFIWGEAQPERY